MIKSNPKRGYCMLEILRVIREAFPFQSTWSFVLSAALIGAVTAGLLAQLVDKAVKNYQQTKPLETPHLEAISTAIKLIFSPSPELTKERRVFISREISLFRDYLIGIGFEMPTTPVVVQIASNLLGGEIGIGSKGSSSSLMFTENSLENPKSLWSAYASHVFHFPFITSPIDKIPNRVGSQFLFALYFTSSYADSVSGYETEWNKALWDIRGEFGQHFVDHLLFFTLLSFDSQNHKIGDNDPDFNAFFMERLERGCHDMDSTPRSWIQIRTILMEHGLVEDEPQQNG